MVTSKPINRAKYTYAERVLQAFSQVRKRNRKHAVHMASLRAQVKKNAQDQRDKLGPQWLNWVTRAVHRLQDEGILASDAPGSITMTPTGNKAVTAARKSLSIPASSMPTVIQEVTHAQNTPSARGTKRTRRSAVMTSMHDYSDEDDLPSSPSPHRRVKAKRARSSVPLGKKSVSQMTKAELKAALKSLETEHANLLMRATSPLTDLDEEEERARLKSELKARDEELERIRRQLNEVRIRTAPPGTHRFDIDRPSSPLSAPSSPLLTAQQRRPSGGVVRTQSGSLICDVSKQPTPVPSSPGVDEAGLLDEEMDNDALGNHGESASRRYRSVTPSLSPMRTGTRDTHLATESSHLKASAEKGMQARKEREHAQSNRIFMLEKTLNARLLEIQEHKGLCTELSDQLSQLKKKISDRDFRVSSLEEELEALRSRLSSSSSEDVAKDTELKNLRISKEALEASFSAKLHEHERSVEQHEEAIALLTDERNKSSKQLDTVQRELQQAEEALAMYSKRITLSQNETLQLRADLECARSELTVQKNQNVSERAYFEEALKEVRETLDRRDLEAASMTRELQEFVAQRNLLEEQLKEFALIEAASKASIEALQARIASCDATLNERQVEIVELNDTLSRARREVSEMRETVVSSELTINDLRKEYDIATSNCADLTKTYRLKCSEFDFLSARMQEVEANAEKYSVALAIARADIDSLTHNLEQVKANENMWRDDLRRAEASHEERVQSLSAEVKQLQEELGNAKSKAVSYENESAEKQMSIGNLQTRLVNSQGQIQEAKNALATAETQYSAACATYESTAAAMRDSLAGTRREIDSLSTQLKASQIAHNKLQDELQERAQELYDVQTNMLAESQKASDLETMLTVAITRANDAEEEVLDLRSSKQADERIIDSLKETFTKLRDVQMQSLAELGDKVHSAHSTPVSKRRLTSMAT